MAGVIAYHLDDVKYKTGKIKGVFAKAFRTAGRDVSRGLDRLFAKAKKENPTGERVKDVKQRLKKEGFEKVGQKGSHDQWKKCSRKLTVPNHGESKQIPTGTLRSIWKQAEWR